MPNTYVIGDIHGGLSALRQVIGKAPLAEGDRLMFLGDLVDGWSESRQVVAYLIELDRQYACIFIRGNHDAWCETWLETGKMDANWLLHGGVATIQSYEGIGDEERWRHLQFFHRMLAYYEDPDDGRLYIHAGFSSMHGPAREHHASNYSWDRTLWEMSLAVDGRISKDSLFYPKRLLLYKEIFIGHTPTTNYNIDIPMNRCNVWNIDTGAAFKGKISIMDVMTKQFWQSDIVQDLYPDETGRNK